MLDDVVADRLDIVEAEFFQHGDQAAGTLVIAGHHRVEVAFHVIGIAHIRAQEAHEILVDDPIPRQMHDRNVDAFLVNLARIRPEPPAAHVDDMAGIGEQDRRPALCRRLA